MRIVSSHQDPPIRNNAIRSGVAPLELVLSLPVLLVLIVGIVWLGNSVIAQTDVTIEARYKTWKKRDGGTGTALLFLKDDVVSDEATQTVNISPIFDDADPPESSHDVMAGAWDFEKLPLDKAPNWKQYLTAAANAKTAGIQNGYVDATNKFTQFKTQSKNVWNTIGAAFIRQLTGLGDLAKSGLEGGDNSSSAEKQRIRNQYQNKIDAKKKELQQAQEKLDDLDKDASDKYRNVLKNRVKRLKSEIADLESDLKAIDE